MSDALAKLHERPTKLLTSNANLAPHGIKNWTIPAWAGRLPDGRTYNTCPSAGICAKGRRCYALKGAYIWRPTLLAHQQRLAYTLDDLPGWTAQMIAEIGRLRPRKDITCEVCKDIPIKIRIHDAGDFYSDAYTLAWLAIAAACPGVLFYAYTKEVERAKRLIEPAGLPNFKIVYSLGGTQDGLVDRDVDRYCDVFPDSGSLERAGFFDQEACDLLAVIGPRPVGMAVNNHPGARKDLGANTFGGIQMNADLAALAKRVKRGRV